MPPTVRGPSDVSATTADDFGNGSVVMIARLAASAPDRSSDRQADAMPLRTFLTSRATPMTPVDATRTCSGAQPTAPAAIVAVSAATFRPAAPVQAFAQPLFTTIAWARPFDRAR